MVKDGTEMEHLLWAATSHQLSFCEKDAKELERIHYQTASLWRRIHQKAPAEVDALVAHIRGKLADKPPMRTMDDARREKG